MNPRMTKVAVSEARLKAVSPNLDFLRSVAVLLVFFSHLLVTFGIPWQGTGLGELGTLGF
jgi:peptidoglycan/LPS O-acetylase OafA/YrhL